jgi:hypothetical protein
VSLVQAYSEEPDQEGRASTQFPILTRETKGYAHNFAKFRNNLSRLNFPGCVRRFTRFLEAQKLPGLIDVAARTNDALTTLCKPCNSLCSIGLC